MRFHRRFDMRIARARVLRRSRLQDDDHLPLPLRIFGLLISIGISLTACDTIAGYVQSDILTWVIAALLLVGLVGFLVQRMRRRP